MKANLIIILIVLLVSANIGYSQEQKLHAFGFFDFEMEFNNLDDIGKSGTFDQHHLNILANYILDNHFSVSTEIEWEHGPYFTSQSSTGKIYLAKAFVTYKHSNAFFIKAGKFLSPFGIYNERHDATPTFLSTFLPQSVYGNKELSLEHEGHKSRLFAKFATGIQVFGNLYLKEWSVKYQLYVSNGRDPNESELDNNTNKGFGWRFVVSPPLKGLQIGTSYYMDKNGLAHNTIQKTLGFDIEYDVSNFHLEAEYIIPKFEKFNVLDIPTGEFRSLRGFYILGAYTFFDKLTPFARYEFFDPDVNEKNNTERTMVFGLNYAATLSVYLKGEVHFHRYQDVSIKEHEIFVLSIAVAF